jgi:hypothetical protein
MDVFVICVDAFATQDQAVNGLWRTAQSIVAKPLARSYAAHLCLPARSRFSRGMARCDVVLAVKSVIVLFCVVFKLVKYSLASDVRLIFWSPVGLVQSNGSL